MSDLPDTTIPNTQPIAPTVVPAPQQSFTPGVGKEGAGVEITQESSLTAVGQEIDLPKEVAAAGVTVHPTSIPVPQPVADLGVKATGQNVPVTPTSGTTITLPLTNDKITEGLQAKPELSVRWLAEWCMRQIQKMHTVVKGHS